MKFRYLSLKGGHRFLIHGNGRISPNSDAEPTKYPSYVLAQEIYDERKTVHPKNAFIGYVKGGVYYGLLGEYEDYNGNHYRFKFENGVLSVRISGAHAGQNEVTYDHDCAVFFCSTLNNDPDFAGNLQIAIGYPFDNGSYTDVSVPALAYALVTSEGAYNGLIGEFGGRQIINIGYIDENFGGKVSMKSTENYKIFGFGYAAGNYRIGPSFGIGTGDNEIEIDDSVSEEDSDEDPYNDDDESDSGGGDGDHDDSSDDIDFPDLPELSAVDTGFVTLYNPSVAELKNLASYMWSNLFDLNTLKKLFGDPMDAILGLSIVPVNVPAGGSQAVIVGNVSTGISMTKAAKQYVEVDCGYVDVKKYWGAYLDYDPYTKFELYLPYVGTKFITADDIMGKRVHIKYHIDILSGACVAYVKCGSSVLYNFQGQCSCEVPVNGNDWSATIEAAVSIAATAATMAATGAPATVSPEPLNGKNGFKVARQYASNYNTERAYNGEIANAVGGAASSAINVTKPAIERSGSFGSMGGMLGIQKPYLVATRPRHCVPGNQNKYQGYPAFVTRNLGSLSGYTEIDSIIIDYIDGTDAEIAELVSILQGGVIL